jgi:hypothetical protein
MLFAMPAIFAAADNSNRRHGYLINNALLFFVIRSLLGAMG